MALEIKAGDKLDFSKIFPDKPTGKVEEILSGAMSNEYKQEINFHGNKKEFFDFFSEISYDFPVRNSLKINFDDGVGFKSAYIYGEIADFVTENLDMSEVMEIIENILPEVYEITIKNGNHEIYSSHPNEYTISSKEKSVNEDIIKFISEDLKNNYAPSYMGESTRCITYELVNAFETGQRVNFVSDVDEGSPETFFLHYSSYDSNGIESSFVEQVEKAVSKIENFNFKREIEEPYLDENKYRVENYLEEQKNGNLKILGIPKDLKNNEAKEVFKKMKTSIWEFCEKDKTVYTKEPFFALKLLEGPLPEEYFPSFKIKTKNLVFEKKHNALFINDGSKNFKNHLAFLKRFEKSTTDILTVGKTNNNISSSTIEGCKGLHVISSEKVADLNVSTFLRKENLNALVTNNSQFSAYGSDRDDIWALIENGNIKIAMSETAYNKMFPENWDWTLDEKKEILYKKTGLDNSQNLYKNIEFQVYPDNIEIKQKFEGKGMLKKIELKSQNIDKEKANKETKKDRKL